MLRRVPVVAVLLLALATLVTPSSAAPAEGVILRGSRTAYVDVHVYEASTIVPADLVLTGRGSFYGFFMSPAPANRPTVGALVMPRVGATGQDGEVMKLGESWDLHAGKYRMFLLTDGPAEVFVPMPGQALRGYQPTRRGPIAVRRADASLPVGSAQTTQRVPVSLRQRSLVVAAERVVSDSLTAVDSLDACIVSDASPCSNPLPARVPTASAWTYSAALKPPGSYTGVLDVVRHGGLDAGGRVDGVVLVLTIGIQT